MKKKRSSRVPQQTTGTRRYRTYPTADVCLRVRDGRGVLFAARQHFSSMDFGMKNSKLRKQIDALQAEKRRLLLQGNVSLARRAEKGGQKGEDRRTCRSSDRGITGLRDDQGQGCSAGSSRNSIGPTCGQDGDDGTYGGVRRDRRKT